MGYCINTNCELHLSDKIKHHNYMKKLILAIFAECFCAVLLALGLLTRLAVIPLMVVMAVAMFRAHNFQIFGDAEKPALFFLIFLTILFVGPGKISVDGMVKK